MNASGSMTIILVGIAAAIAYAQFGALGLIASGVILLMLKK